MKMIIRVAAGTLHTLVRDPAAPNSPPPVYSVHLYGSSALLQSRKPALPLVAVLDASKGAQKAVSGLTLPMGLETLVSRVSTVERRELHGAQRGPGGQRHAPALICISCDRRHCNV